MKRGDKVICVNVNGFEYDGKWNHPRLRGIYTIQEVLHDGAIVLEEIDNRYIDMLLLLQGKNDRSAFYQWHFEKVNIVVKIREFFRKKVEPKETAFTLNINQY